MSNDHFQHVVLIALMMFGVDIFMIGAHYALYSHSMSFMPGAYLSDIPGFEWLFLETEVQVSNLVALITAFASVVTPVAGFFYILRERIVTEPDQHFACFPNCMTFGLLVAFWIFLIGLEVFNVMTLVDMYFNDPLRQPDSMLGSFSQSKALSLLFSIVVTAVNQGIGLFSAFIYNALFSKEEH